MFFLPDVYLHLTKDFIRTRKDLENEIIDYISNKAHSRGIINKRDFLKRFINLKEMDDL